MPSVKVSSKHQVSVPSVARAKLGIRAGDRLEVTVTDVAIVLTKRPAHVSERLRGLGSGIWACVDPVEYVRELRGDRTIEPHADD